ncbi:unnamed protein product [Calypogeia fissa]
MDGEVIDLTKETLASIFKFGMGDAKDTTSRARAWHSQKFSTPKEKNEYKLSNCTNTSLVKRLEFIRASLYLQDRKNLIARVQVHEAEEVRGGSTDWAKHFYKQFHHELGLASNTKKSKLGSHIRIIFLTMHKNKKAVGIPQQMCL